ncbi:MAG: hypothetical protein UX31_C0003G0024 [Candidatus Nomurabacteria bacterium GW2011_GWA1_46_11]|uniref:Uncharacterized protein n=1 Tax=Candidatus Nomurabacteria bacterium GW2011_GWA1_46_11 TaxID=1618732 RepID=A0A0G1QX20_9BACT|nr:MAG: hypothetical protein UW69_C0026G0001 [Microgenomates group bacterium GW2011_GWA2_44_7]KKT78300.1 MAG: hypothetical protein UW73_C0004G0024 [Microgenomates group bacterium GW2011_GWB1_44_8]KKU22358.1 MAG: hypothetical protein UX31_C0003G0024 [Candidatus Nomurabacteria bacterium GW2011_GWA1_46_11]
MNFTKKIISAIATGSLVMQLLVTPAFASTVLQISGNGANTTSTATVTSNTTTAVTQSNSANINNDIDADSDSGNNSAIENTGGDVRILTGDASTGIRVENVANKNSASVACCENSDTLLRILGNGANSTNASTADLRNTNVLTQDNSADVHNDVDADAKTGWNDAGQNTNGNVLIDTGTASVGTIIRNVLNNNAAAVNGCCDGETKAVIAGNGAESANRTSLSLANTNVLTQYNSADVYNDVDADAKTGWNDADQNTGGSVTINTGDALVQSLISTAANANRGIIGGLTGNPTSVILDIFGNGFASDNTASLALSRTNVLTQDNSADVHNDVDADAKSGKNDANENVGGDVLIDTGDAIADLGIVNRLNFNRAALDCCGFDIAGVISDNGAQSTGDITSSLDDLKVITQSSAAGLDNSADADPTSGKNDADAHTAAISIIDPVTIRTGDAISEVEVANLTNGNSVGIPFELPFEFDFDWTDLSIWWI